MYTTYEKIHPTIIYEDSVKKILLYGTEQYLIVIHNKVNFQKCV